MTEQQPRTIHFFCHIGARVTQIGMGTVPDESFLPPPQQPGEKLVVVEPSQTAGCTPPALWLDGRIQPLPEQPSPNHEFDWDALAWVLNTRRLTDEVLARRAALLRASDWVTLRALDQGQPLPPDWAAYRQALRDVTEQAEFPEKIDWPEAPSA